MSDLKVLGIFHVTKGSLMKLLWIITSNLKGSPASEFWIGDLWFLGETVV